MCTCVCVCVCVLQDLSHKMSIKLTSSKKETAEEAEAIAKALLVTYSSCDPSNLASHDSQESYSYEEERIVARI